MSRGPAAASDPVAAFFGSSKSSRAELVLHAEAGVALRVNNKAVAGHAAHQMLQPGLLCGLPLVVLQQ